MDDIIDFDITANFSFTCKSRVKNHASSDAWNDLNKRVTNVLNAHGFENIEVNSYDVFPVLDKN